MSKRSHGEGSIQARGNAWRIRYRINGQRFEKTVQRSRVDAAKALREALKAGDDGKHVAANKLTLREWSRDCSGECGGEHKRIECSALEAVKQGGQLRFIKDGASFAINKGRGFRIVRGWRSLSVSRSRESPSASAALFQPERWNAIRTCCASMFGRPLATDNCKS